MAAWSTAEGAWDEEEEDDITGIEVVDGVSILAILVGLESIAISFQSKPNGFRLSAEVGNCTGLRLKSNECAEVICHSCNR